jgi:RNA polymerase sigma-70 factor (ECF subfamily)
VEVGRELAFLQRCYLPVSFGEVGARCGVHSGGTDPRKARATMQTTILPTPCDSPAPTAAALSWADLAEHRSFLVRYAQRRLLDPALAEDLVHDVFEAVMTGRASFAGRSAPRSWLVAILRHKIVDLVRQRVGHDSLDTCDLDDEFTLECPSARPDEVAEQRELLSHALARIDALPASLREAMQLRVLRDQTTEAVCQMLGISEANLFVRLHRARRALMAH